MRPYRGRTPRRFQGPQADPSGGWLACLAFLLGVGCTTLAVFEDAILKAVGW
jgi:hypothetical protein